MCDLGIGKVLILAVRCFSWRRGSERGAKESATGSLGSSKEGVDMGVHDLLCVEAVLWNGNPS